MKKWFKRIIYMLFAITLLLGIVFYAFYKRFAIEAPEKSYPVVHNLKEQQLYDLEYLSLYIDYDRSFDTEQKRNSFIASIKGLEKRLPISTERFEMEVAKLMAISENTHSNIHPGHRARRLNAVPLRFYWFKEGLYVVMAKSKYKDLIGKKIKTINGNIPDTMLYKLKEWYGGSPYRLKFFSPLYMMSPQLLTAIGLGTNKELLEIEYYDTEDRIKSQKIQAEEDGKGIAGYWPPNWLNPKEKALKKDWHSVPMQFGQALPFKNISKNVRHQFVNDGLYVQLNENKNTAKTSITDYLNKVEREAKQQPLDFVVLDLRFNPGGDYHLARPFLKAMKECLNKPDKFYVITGNGTFSAGIITVVLAKHIFDGKTRIIGENVGDKLQFWADGGSPMVLPNSKIKLRIWTAYHDWQNGCSDWSKCFWITIFDGVGVDYVYPNEEIILTFEDFVSGRDTALEHILSEQQ